MAEALACWQALTGGTGQVCWPGLAVASREALTVPDLAENVETVLTSTDDLYLLLQMRRAGRPRGGIDLRPGRALPCS